MSVAHDFSLGQQLVGPWAEGLAVGAGEQWNYVESLVSFEPRVEGHGAGGKWCAVVRVGKAGFQAGLQLGGRTAVLAAFFAALVRATLFVDLALIILAAAVSAALFALAALILTRGGWG